MFSGALNGHLYFMKSQVQKAEEVIDQFEGRLLFARWTLAGNANHFPFFRVSSLFSGREMLRCVASVSHLCDQLFPTALFEIRSSSLINDHVFKDGGICNSDLFSLGLVLVLQEY